MRRALVYLALGIGLLVFAYPFLWMAAGTFKPVGEVTQFGLWGSDASLDAYRFLFGRVTLGRAFLNSLIVAGSVTFLVLLTGSLAGYSLAWGSWRGRGAIYNGLLFTMMVPAQLTLIPLYVLMVRLHLTETYAALILPFAVNALAIVLMRQFFLALPKELLDAARVDGASEWTVLRKVVWPLSRPVLITVGIITFMGIWNEVLWPLLVIHEEPMMPMPLVVTLFAVGGRAEGNLGAQLAAALLLALPVVLAYLFLQRYFIESLASSGLKG